MNAWIEVFGRLHPMVLHVPIGCALALVVLEALVLTKRIERQRTASIVVSGLGSATAIFGVVTGLVLSRGTDYEGEALITHRNVAIAFSAILLLAFGAYTWSKSLSLQRCLLAVAALLVAPAGHLGNTITRGEGFLTAPLEASKRAPVPAHVGAPIAKPEPRRSTYEEEIAPFLAARCTNCHGEVKKKGKLQLHTFETIVAGGESGVALVAGDAATSEITRRMRLPLEDDDHMPPKGKTQPNQDEVARVEAWIQAGATKDAVVARAPVTAPVASADSARGVTPTSANSAAANTSTSTKEPPQAALDALKARLVHAQRLPGGSNLLWVDFAALARTVDDAELVSLLEPLVDHVGELSLARTGCSDAVMDLLARCTKLRRLDLRATAISDAGLAKIAKLASLETLVVAQTKLTDASSATIASLSALTVLHAWNSGLSHEALAKLRADHPKLVVEAGDTPAAAVLDAEKELKFTNTAAVEGATSGLSAAAVDLKPVNTTCPVTGSPANAKFSVVHSGRVIGFCCPNCPKQFWEDPTKFESKLP